jgi:Glycosyl transferase family 11
MIVTKLIGGLGNQLFQYALARKLALDKNTEVVLDIDGFEDYKLHKFSLQYFAFKMKFTTKRDKLFFQVNGHKNNSLVSKIRNRLLKPVIINEQQFNYDPQVFSSAKRHTYLNGYWQTEKYFSDIRDVLLKDLMITRPLEEKNLEVATLISKVNAVSVHMRRGDYVSNSETLKIHGICSFVYYQEALEILSGKESDIELFVFSDDIPWCQENFRPSFKTHYIDNNNADTNYEDLRLMSLCKHNIIANSSFSWWGAWLNNNPGKTVIAPQTWFQTDDRNYNDVIPDQWIKI